MEIKWANVFAFALAIGGLVIGLRWHRQMTSFLSLMAHVGPGHDSDEQTKGLIACGLVFISLLALVRILIEANRKD